MNAFQKIFNSQKAHFDTDLTRTYAWRIDQLNRLEKMLRDNEEEFHKAIGTDFKTTFAEQVFETQAPLGTIEFTKAQLSEWMRPVPAPVPKFLAKTGHRAEISREPYGVTLIIGPFNGPLILLLHPAITAISAGNPVILKVNDAVPATSKMLLRLIPQYFEPESVAVVSGDIDTTTQLLKLPFDFIFFTGSTAVGKVIMRAAAENLTPVLLELGGQNPAIVDETADIADAAQKIVWGATAWGGQWCTSPGYALVHESVAENFVEEARKAIEALYGKNPKAHPDFSRIINSKKVKQLAALLETHNVVAGGETDENARYVAPTIVYPVQWTDKIMEAEIFGPILPILTYKDIDEAITRIKELPKPLSAYIFSSDEKKINYFLQRVSFGGGAVNQVNVHIYVESMPFGGVGNSGIGHYYGKYGYDSLTHAKSILFAPSGQEIEHLIPPYTPEKVQALKNWFDY
jgi:aldehyde dehydrogenase (NAD+)